MPTPKRSAQDDFNALSSFLEWMGEAKSFMNEMMSRRGHKPVTSWADADPNESSGNKDDNVFGIRFGGPAKQNNGPGWQYGS
jgi:hypothetical protein